MPKFVTAFFVGIASVLAGCGGTLSIQEVQPEQVYQRYQIHYDVAQAKTLVQAEFLKGSPSGVPLELTGEAKVSDNGIELKRPADFAPFYSAVEPKLVEEHRFLLTHANGTTETNVVRLERIAPHVVDPNKPETIPPKQDFYIFHWTGSPVGKDETVYGIIENDTGIKTEQVTFKEGKWVTEKLTNRTARYVSTNTEGAVSVRLEKADLDAIGTGKRTIKFQRVRRVTIGDAEKPRGVISASYMSETTPLLFEKAEGEPDKPGETPRPPTTRPTFPGPGGDLRKIK